MTRRAKQPAEQADGASPLSGVAPPAEHRWRPGQSGNPAGRPRSAGATAAEWLNTFCAQDLTDADLRKIVRDRRTPHHKRIAAERLMHQLRPRMADYEGLVDGTKTLADLEREGIDTSLVKKLKTRQELDAKGNVVAVTRELELHNVAGEEFDRVADRTEGKPGQSVQVTGDMPTSVTFIFPKLPDCPKDESE